MEEQTTLLNSGSDDLMDKIKRHHNMIFNILRKEYSVLKNKSYADWDNDFSLIKDCFGKLGQNKSDETGVDKLILDISDEDIVIPENDLFNLDFSFVKLHNVSFAKKKNIFQKQLHSIRFCFSHLESVSFENCILYKCNFDSAFLDKVNFSHSNLMAVRFKDVLSKLCDFRYSFFKNSHFDRGIFLLDDFYMANFENGVSFEDARIQLCSFTKTHFSGEVITTDNFVNKKNKLANTNKAKSFWLSKDYLPESFSNSQYDYSPFVQSNKNIYSELFFGGDWKRSNPNGEIVIPPTKTKSQLLLECKQEYQHLYGLYLNKGLLYEAEKVRKKSKEHERIYYYNRFKEEGELRALFHSISLWCFKFTCGYGSSMIKLLITFCLFISSLSLINSFLINKGSFVEVLRNGVYATLGGSTNVDYEIAYKFVGILFVCFLGIVFGNTMKK